MRLTAASIALLAGIGSVLHRYERSLHELIGSDFSHVGFQQPVLAPDGCTYCALKTWRAPISSASTRIFIKSTTLVGDDVSLDRSMALPIANRQHLPCA